MYEGKLNVKIIREVADVYLKTMPSDKTISSATFQSCEVAYISLSLSLSPVLNLRPRKPRHLRLAFGGERTDAVEVKNSAKVVPSSPAASKSGMLHPLTKSHCNHREFSQGSQGESQKESLNYFPGAPC